MDRIQKWLTMICLCLAGSSIYQLTYIREFFEVPLQNALEISNTQFGVLGSILGLGSFFCYLPGGWLADRFSPRKLLSFSLVATGAGGLYLATFPAYHMVIAIFVFWSICSILTFWAALIKATREWGGAEEQGRAFGMLEGGRNLVKAISTSGLLLLFSFLGEKVYGFFFVLIALSLINIVVGMLVWFAMKELEKTDEADHREGLRLGDIKEAIMLPSTWLIALVIISAYAAHVASYSFSSYATRVFEQGSTSGGMVNLMKTWLAPFCAIFAGYVCDKVGASRVISAAFILLILSFGVFATLPANPELFYIVVLNTIIASLGIFALRGVFYALLEEGGIPIALTGTVTGVVSVIGYTPDIFLPILKGVLLDTYGEQLGYRYLFGIVVGFCCLGLTTSLVINKIHAKADEKLSSA